MPRAGWAGGMLRASKLYQSVSTSGPSATTNPMPDEDVLERVAGLGTRCRWPRADRPGPVPRHELGQVEPGARPSRRPARRSGSPAPAASSSSSTVARASCSWRPELLAGVGVHRPERTVTPRPARTRLPEHRGRHLAELLGGVGRRRWRPGRSSTSASTSTSGPRTGAPGVVRAPPVVPSMADIVERAWSPGPPSGVRCGAGAAPRSTARRPPLDVEGLRPPGHGDGHPRRRGAPPARRQPVGLVAEHQGDRAGPVDVGVVGAAADTAATRRESPAPQSVEPRRPRRRRPPPRGRGTPSRPRPAPSSG